MNNIYNVRLDPEYKEKPYEPSKQGRDIKFRVWYPKENKFYCTNIEGTAFTLGKDAWCEPYTIQLFTGLIDNVGIEIYEGDIIKFKDDFTAEVFWCQEDAAFQIRTSNGGGAYVNERYVQNFEVIGNIFQNPNLLNNIKNRQP